VPAVETPARAASRAPSSAGRRFASIVIRTPLRIAISCACPSSPKPVTSVTASGPIRRSTSAASLFSVRIQRTASSSGQSPRFAPPSTSAVPSGFVR
jgi:hypothetical protein